MKNSIRLVLTYLSFLIAIGCNQIHDEFIIKGKVKGFKDSTKLYLYNPASEENIDSSLVINGEFQLKGNVPEPIRLYINTVFSYIDGYKFTSFFVENSKINIKGDYNHFRYCEISGSESQKIENKLIVRIKNNDLMRDSLEAILYKNRASVNKQQKMVIWQKIRILDSINILEYKRFIKENINSYAALEKLQWQMSEMPKDTLRMYYNQLTPQFKESTNGKLIDTYLNSRTIEVGKKYIDFDAVTLNGNPFKLSDVKTDFILLDFWAANCAPCRIANKEFAKQYLELKPHMEIVSFSLDKKMEIIKKASEKDGIEWINVSDFKGTNSEIVIQYQVSGIPCSYLINKDRIVIKKYVGFKPEYINEIKTIIYKN